MTSRLLPLSRVQASDMLLKAAGLELERALFPLLIAVAKFGPIGVVDLAEGIGRDYTTVSRQIALIARKVLVDWSETDLEQLALLMRRFADAIKASVD